MHDAARPATRWWTFAGGKANAALAVGLDAAGIRTTSVDDLSIGVGRQLAVGDLAAAIETMKASLPQARVDHRELEGLKFADCLPTDLAMEILARRRADPDAVYATLAEPLATRSGAI